jgi:lysophospholipase L1-like esterase
MLLDQNFGSTEVVNEGWPGEITQNGLGRIDSVIRNHMARYLLLMEGTNDIIFKRISMDTTVFNLKQMVKRCLDFGVFPAIATIIPRNDWKWRHKFFRNRIFYLNEKIRELANNFPIPLVDQFNLFYYYPEEKGGWESLLSDYNHPSEEGYQLMAEEWFEEIKNFPFPPLNFRVKRTYNEILFYRELGNAISWDDNPKIFDMTKIEAYKIYRKRAEDGNDLFKVIQIIHDQQNYFDKDINPSVQYVYVISTLRTDKVEGPCSEPKQDH